MYVHSCNGPCWNWGSFNTGQMQHVANGCNMGKSGLPDSYIATPKA